MNELQIFLLESYSPQYSREESLHTGFLLKKISTQLYESIPEACNSLPHPCLLRLKIECHKGGGFQRRNEEEETPLLMPIWRNLCCKQGTYFHVQKTFRSQADTLSTWCLTNCILGRDYKTTLESDILPAKVWSLSNKQEEINYTPTDTGEWFWMMNGGMKIWLFSTSLLQRQSRTMSPGSKALHFFFSLK